MPRYVTGVGLQHSVLPTPSSFWQPSIVVLCRCNQVRQSARCMVAFCTQLARPSIHQLYDSKHPLIMPSQSEPEWCVQDTSKLGRREILSSCLTMAVGSACGEPFWSFKGMAAQPKQYSLPIESVKEIIERDIRDGQYYITGNLTQTIYDDSCRFTDPTTDITGVDKYVAAIKLLFDPTSSHHELISIAVTGPDTIQAKWKLEGYLKVAWHPHILPYEGTTQYKLNNNGLVVSHEETWDLSVWTAFFQFFTPSWKPL